MTQVKNENTTGYTPSKEELENIDKILKKFEGFFDPIVINIPK